MSPRSSIFKCAGLLATLMGSLPAANVLHYRDFDTQTGGVPDDVIGGLVTSETGNADVSQHATYGEAYPGAGASLNTVLGGTSAGGGFLVADVHGVGGATAMIFNASFSLSYWSYDASNLDANPRGPRVFDSLAGTDSGLQLATNATGVFNYRMDNDGGADVISNNTLGSINQADGVWTHVAVNVDRDSNQAEVFFNGVSQGTYGIGTLTGAISPSQDLEIGVINGGGVANTAQQSGLDDLAFYDGILSSDEIAGLASGALTPDMIAIPEPGSSILLMLGLSVCLRRRR